MSKKKILIISDHALSPSGVGVQTKYLAEGLLKTDNYTIMQLGAAIKHQNYNTVKVCEDFYIKPIDGFGNVNLLRSVLLNEQPDALIIFTDPRFFTWLFEIEDEIRQVCPILWWHVWDNYPYPEYNNWMYESTDVINCHSYLTYSMLKNRFPNKTNFIPHTFPENAFYQMSKDEILSEKGEMLGDDRKDNFVCLWINRNCKRKRPADVLHSWKLFLDGITLEERGKVTLLMHTNPQDNAGQNLFKIAEMLDILDTVAFSVDKISYDQINVVHNIADVCLNISFNEGFGLSTLEAMMTGTPIIASKTGGLYRQVIDFRDNSENGIGLDIDMQSIAGNQDIPYIYEDYVDSKNVAKAIFKFFKLSKDQRKKLSNKCKKYADFAFSYKESIKLWDKSIIDCLKEFECQKKKSKIEIVII